MDRVIFRRLGARGVQEAVQRFLESWGADSAKDLERMLGCAVSERLLLGLFRGVDAGCSRYLQGAALAFALQHSTAEDRQVCMTRECGFDGPEELFADGGAKYSAPALVRDLCRLAGEAGYPVAAARGLADGRSPRQLATLVAPKVTERFLGLLPIDVNARYKELLSELSARAPCRMPLTQEAVRERISAKIHQGCMTRTQLFMADSSAYKWALRNDSVWLDQVLPRSKERRRPTWREAGQAVIRRTLIAAIREGVDTRTLLRAKRSAAYKAALQNDAEWLDCVLALRRKRRP
ncbi:hypothetical protein [Roseateles sp.]|uniref:hypothetical protein n=1 Tax=Roseateles sp. TaxID=1971397 RepID=UPI0031DC0421